MQQFKAWMSSCFSYNVHNEMIKDDTPAVDALGSPLDELLGNPFSIGEYFAEYVDVTAIPAEVDDITVQLKTK